jgi:hypothetical protein
MEVRRAKNVATYIVAPLVDADGDPVSGAAGLDSEIDAWADGAAPDGFSDCTNEATEIGTTGMYYLSLTQAEMNNDYIVVQIKTSTAGAKTQVILINTKNQPADVLAISGDATAADNEESFFDGTGYAGTNNVIPTVTTLTNLPAAGATAAELAKVPKSDSTVSLNATALGAIADAVHDEALSGHTTAGTAGKALGDAATGASHITADYGSTEKSAIDLLDDATHGVSDLATAIADLPTNAELGTALAGADDATLAAIAALNNPSAAGIADAVWDEAATGHVDAGKAGQQLWTDLDAILADTDELQGNQGDWATATGFSIFDPATDAVAEVTLVDTCTVNSDMVAEAPTSEDNADSVWNRLTANVTAANSIGKRLLDFVTSLVYAAPPAAAPGVSDIADAVWDEATADHPTAGSTGKALTDAGSSGDPWATTLPGEYGAGSAGKIIGDNLNATVGSRLATAGYTAPPSAASNASAVRTELGTELGRIDAAISTRLATAGYTAPDNADVAAIKLKTDNLPSDPADESALEAAIAALPTDSDVQVAAAAALTAYDPPTKAELDSAVSGLATGADVAALNDISAADVRTQADAALTAYDPPTHTEATSDKEEVIAAMGDIDLSGVSVTVDLTPVTDILEPIEADLAHIGALEVIVTSPVASSGTVTLHQGDDYDAAHSRALSFTVSVAGAPNLAGATVKLKCSQATWEATGCTSDGTDWTITFEPDAADTTAITRERQAYELEATLSDNDVVTLATGILVCVADIPELA